MCGQLVQVLDPMSFEHGNQRMPPACAQAVSAGAHPLTMAGLAGMGDLVLTCTGAAPVLTFALWFGTFLKYKAPAQVPVLS